MTKCSIHAKQRMNQRGVKEHFLSLILSHADIDAPAGSNCRLLRVRRRTAARLNLGDNLSNYAVIWSDDNNQAVSIMPMRKSRSGARYRQIR